MKGVVSRQLTVGSTGFAGVGRAGGAGVEPLRGSNQWSVDRTGGAGVVSQQSSVGSTGFAAVGSWRYSVIAGAASPPLDRERLFIERTGDEIKDLFGTAFPNLTSKRLNCCNIVVRMRVPYETAKVSGILLLFVEDSVR